jgi:hypothetical protein
MGQKSKFEWPRNKYLISWYGNTLFTIISYTKKWLFVGLCEQ